LPAFSPPKGLEKEWLLAELFSLASFFSARGARQEVLPASKLPGLKPRMFPKRKNDPDICPGHLIYKARYVKTGYVKARNVKAR